MKVFSDEHEALAQRHGYTTRCDCPDAVQVYEPCERCGQMVGWNGASWVEAPVEKGCLLDGRSHGMFWTPHDAGRCRSLRRSLAPIPAPAR